MEFSRGAQRQTIKEFPKGVNFLAPKLPSLDAIGEVEVDRNISS